MNVEQIIYQQAQEAAQEAAKLVNDSLPPEQQRGLDCGFAWVVIKPARGKFVSYCKKLGVGSTRDYGGGGYEIWWSAMHNIPTQSIGVHLAAASAFAKVLRLNDINATVGSRLD